MNNRRFEWTKGLVGLLLLALALAPLYVANEYHLHVLIIVFYNIILASSLRLIMTMGLVSFAHGAFVAIGGYASALLVMRLGLNFWLAIWLAMLAAALISGVFGVILLRLKGVYFLMATTAFGEIVLLVFTRFTEPFGGPAGLVNIPPPNPIWLPWLGTLVFTGKLSFYYLFLVLMLILLLILYRLDRGRLGAIWTGLDQAENLARAVGINTMLFKVTAFTIGSTMAALGGAFQAHYYTHINPAGFGIFVIINYVVWVVVGGSKSYLGPIVGAAALTLISEGLALYEQLALFQPILFGAILILVILFLPEGLVSLWGKYRYKRPSRPRTDEIRNTEAAAAFSNPGRKTESQPSAGNSLPPDPA
ncbi:MAG: branched-chain amino acid ABC transporter permease [Thermodesulfobacteriota bacterium]